MFLDQGALIELLLSFQPFLFLLFFSGLSPLCSVFLSLLVCPLAPPLPSIFLLLTHGFLLKLCIQSGSIGSTQHPRFGEHIPLELRHGFPGRNFLGRVLDHITSLQLQLLDTSETANRALDLQHGRNIDDLAVNLDFHIAVKWCVDI